MTDRITAPFTHAQVTALNAFQRSGVMHPFTCGADHDMHQTLVAAADGWHCPDEDCDYWQSWAHSFMADPPDGVVVWSRREEVPRTDPMAAELRKTKQQLRETEDQLAQLRRDSTNLAAKNNRLQERLTAAETRLHALRIHEAICRVEAAIPAPADPPCGEIILGGKPIDAAGSIDAYEEAGA